MTTAVSYRLSPYEHELMESHGHVGSLYAHDLLLHYVSVGNAEGLEWMRKWYQPAKDATYSLQDVDAREVVAGAVSVVTDVRIIRAITEDTERLLRLSPREFERFTAELLEELGYTGITLGRGSKDGGVDVSALIEHGFGVEKLIVECKRYTTRKVGEPIVKQLLANVGLHHAARGLIITTSTFTKPASMLVSSMSYRLSAADIDDIRRQLSGLAPNNR